MSGAGTEHPARIFSVESALSEPRVRHYRHETYRDDEHGRGESWAEHSVRGEARNRVDASVGETTRDPRQRETEDRPSDDGARQLDRDGAAMSSG